MTGVGIYKGDVLLVDRSMDPKHNHIVVAQLNNEFTVKRLYRRGGTFVIELLANLSLCKTLYSYPCHYCTAPLMWN